MCSWSTIFTWCFATKSKKISGISLDQWIPTGFHTCRRLIYDAISDGAIEEVEYENGDDVDTRLIRYHFHFDSFRPFSFLDDFAIPSAHPGSLTRWNHHFQHDSQHTCYSGYLGQHGFKAEVVYLPIGIIGLVSITKLWQNDNGFQNVSGLNNYLL